MTTKLDMLAKLQEQKCLDNSDLLEDKKEKASIWFATLRDEICKSCLLYTSPSPRDRTRSRMPSSA